MLLVPQSSSPCPWVSRATDRQDRSDSIATTGEHCPSLVTHCFAWADEVFGDQCPLTCPAVPLIVHTGFLGRWFSVSLMKCVRVSVCVCVCVCLCLCVVCVFADPHYCIVNTAIILSLVCVRLGGST